MSALEVKRPKKTWLVIGLLAVTVVALTVIATGSPDSRGVTSVTTAPPPRSSGIALTTSSPTSTQKTHLTGVCRVVDTLTTLPLSEQLRQLVLVGVANETQARTALAGTSPFGGIFLVGSNGSWFAQQQLQHLAAVATVPPIVAADEEGGRVTRISTEAGPFPSAHAMGTTMSPSAVQVLAKTRGANLARLGITMDFAPDADLYDPTNAVINDRAFSSSPSDVITYDTAFSAGLEESRVVPTIKHFPGHGHSSGDSHQQIVHSPPLVQLESADLKPFASLSSSAMVMMVGHLDVAGLTEPGRPASLSANAMNLLRDQLNFKGYVLTDDLSMAAVTARFSIANAAVIAIAAGADGVLITPTSATTLTAVVDRLQDAVASGELPLSRVQAALAHVEAVKRFTYCG